MSNTAVAVHPDETYVVARSAGDGDRVVVAEELLDRVLGDGWQVVARVPGSSARRCDLPAAVRADRYP